MGLESSLFFQILDYFCSKMNLSIPLGITRVYWGVYRGFSEFQGIFPVLLGNVRTAEAKGRNFVAFGQLKLSLLRPLEDKAHAYALLGSRNGIRRSRVPVA